MTAIAKKPFSKRAFVSLVAGLSGLGLPFTGIPLHRLAFEQFTAQRHAWMTAHNTFAFIFTVFAIWHVLLNRKALMNYTKGLVSGMFPMSYETIAAVLVIAVILALVVGHAFMVR